MNRTQLLSESDPAWYNLGFWPEASTYDEAAEALAMRIGEAAALRAGSVVLDLACGSGASLKLWRERWHVGAIDALEAKPAHRSQLQALQLPELEVLAAPSVEALWQSPINKHYDAILAVDAAYHFASAQNFIRDSKKRLKPSGYLAFTTLIKTDNWAQAKLMDRIVVRLLCRMASMPRLSLLSKQDWLAIAGVEGWTECKISELDQEVLQGFAKFVEERNQELEPWQRYQRAWWKIKLTGKWAAWLQQKNLLHYALISLKVGPKNLSPEIKKLKTPQ